jgi:DNA modification methylase
MLEINKIYNMDCVEGTKLMDDESVNCCVTSPPYWNLRDYGVAGQIGLEPTLELYIEKMVEVFREVRRVLRNDGTLWLNLGDSYASSTSNKHDEKWIDPANPKKGGTRCRTDEINPKNLIGIPWRVAFALQADGWYLRSDIIWAKPNPMPESVTDRPTKAHEYIFLLSKSAKYYYDYQAIKEPLAKASHQRLAQDIANQKGSERVPGKANGTMKAVASGLTFGGKKGREYTPDKDDPNFRNGSEQWGREYVPTPDGKANKRTVWTVTAQPFKESHFATFPPKLIEPCILAGCPKDGIVLDPFMGSGTTAMVAAQLQRNYIGLELNPKYITIAEKSRLKNIQLKIV